MLLHQQEGAVFQMHGVDVLQERHYLPEGRLHVRRERCVCWVRVVVRRAACGGAGSG